jgi:hypothetical protein
VSVCVRRGVTPPCMQTVSHAEAVPAVEMEQAAETDRKHTHKCDTSLTHPCLLLAGMASTALDLTRRASPGDLTCLLVCCCIWISVMCRP